QGHVDTTARCTALSEENGSWRYDFNYSTSEELRAAGYVTVEKGSVTVNGVSLTVCNSTPSGFQVAIIPYTYNNTNFHTFALGSVVNIEFDILGKYLARLMAK
ncbi:MAG: riboflavin synthase, partial [Mucinivorans sp.]